MCLPGCRARRLLPAAAASSQFMPFPPCSRQATCSSSSLASLHRHQEGRWLRPGGWKAITPLSGILLSQTRWSWGSRRHRLPKARVGAARTAHPQGGPSSALQSSADPSTGHKTAPWSPPGALHVVEQYRTRDSHGDHSRGRHSKSGGTEGTPRGPWGRGCRDRRSFHRAWGGGHPTQSRAVFSRWPGPF